jgi:cell volume regulation protein A
MFPVDRLLLVAAILLLIGIASSKFSARLGLPVLVLFLAIGMFAGSEGIGGIAFENYELAHGIGTIALAVILFDGGLRTPFSSFRAVAAPALTLATVGVLATAVITGWVASAIMGAPLLEGLLLGSIIGSTDAAAVFAVLRSKGLHLSPRLAATLEVESGSNDPMAIFLTVGLLQILTGGAESAWELVRLFFLQMTVGAVTGVVVGRGAVTVINRIQLDAAGLYPVLTAAAGLLAYGLAATLGGSGFLAVYLAGIVIGNSRIVFQQGIFLFHDGAAWLSQIVMFVLLGLLSSPSRLADVAEVGLLVSAVLILVARPIAIAILLAPFRYDVKQVAFIAWVGLKGAVPIVLATYPLQFAYPNGLVLFDITFFVVLVSAVTQGWSIPPLARALGLQVPSEPEPPVMLEITSLRDVDGDIVEYAVTPRSRAQGRLVRELALPEGAVIAMIARESHIIPPRGSTRIELGDHVYIVMNPAVRPVVDRIFSRDPTMEPAIPAETEFLLGGWTTLADLEEFYGITPAGDSATTLDEFMRARLDGAFGVGSAVAIGPVLLRVREVENGQITRVGLRIREAAAPEAAREAAPSADESPTPQ